MRLEGIINWKIKLVSNQTRDLPVCSIVPRPTVLSRTRYSITFFSLNLGRLKRFLCSPLDALLLLITTSSRLIRPNKTADSLQALRRQDTLVGLLVRRAGKVSPFFRVTGVPLIRVVTPCLISTECACFHSSFIMCRTSRAQAGLLLALLFGPEECVFSESSVDFRHTARRYIPEDRTFFIY
jgi:hypothetical protein